jgi:UDP-N-acetylglucosamine 2-epimerase
MTDVRVVQIVGARPQFIKLAPVSRALARYADRGVTELIVHTGQHYDPQLSEVFFEELAIPRAAVNLEVGSATHGRQTGAMLERLETYLLGARPHAVIVYGDTNSTLAGTLAATKLGIAVAHIEAGLRSFNRAMPEELNRVATDHLADLLLAPTAAAAANLAREGLAARTQLVGDVMYDALLANLQVAHQRSQILERLQLGGAAFGLVTLHRAESTDAATLRRVLGILNEIAAALLPLVFVVHPRTAAAIKAGLPQWQAAAALRLIEPLGPMDMLRLTEAAAVVITDSGGLQKEAFMLGRPCVTLRTETEWVETVAAGANTVVGHDAAAALTAVRRALADGAQIRRVAAQQASALYGGGQAAERCVAHVLRLAGVAVGTPAAAAAP